MESPSKLLRIVNLLYNTYEGRFKLQVDVSAYNHSIVSKTSYYWYFQEYLLQIKIDFGMFLYVKVSFNNIG